MFVFECCMCHSVAILAAIMVHISSVVYIYNCILLFIQVSRALKLSTERSLIILDEFGKGTATVSVHYMHYYQPPHPSIVTGGWTESSSCFTVSVDWTREELSQHLSINSLSQYYQAKAPPRFISHRILGKLWKVYKCMTCLHGHMCIK